jgi:hypothetical protein
MSDMIIKARILCWATALPAIGSWAIAQERTGELLFNNACRTCHTPAKSLFKPCTKLPDQVFHAHVLSVVSPAINATATNVFQAILQSTSARGRLRRPAAYLMNGALSVGTAR